MNGNGNKPGAAMNRADAATGEERSDKILTLPNILSFMRILLTPVFVWAIVERRPWLAFGIFLLAGATDALDGFTARHFRLKRAWLRGTKMASILPSPACSDDQ